ncbi:hypothetical protein [Alienimonas sp. DA493]|uniref:hypothetical protein n=1 Tax=Alienimonas sp. DA493 TaxID=3373605 RepID=UPI0037549114
MFALGGQMHRASFRKKQGPSWKTVGDRECGMVYHLRSGLDADPLWKSREYLFGLPLIAAAACRSKPWPVGGMITDRHPDRVTMVHAFRRRDVPAGSNPFGWIRPNEVPPPYVDFSGPEWQQWPAPDPREMKR